MKYALSLVVVLTMLVGCNDAKSDASVAKKMLKPLINKQCGQELDQSKLFNATTYWMAANNKQQLHKQVCECVSEHALTDISTKDLVRAMIDDELKNQLIQKAVLNTVKACILKISS